VGEDTEVLFVGCLPVDIELNEQEARSRSYDYSIIHF